jgi:signal peptidase I
VIAGISIAVVILVLMRVTGLGFFEVEGDSMSPAFHSGDLVLVRSTGGDAGRGDVVIVSPRRQRTS